VNPLARITFIRGCARTMSCCSYSYRCLCSKRVILTGAYAVSENWFDIDVVLAFGIIGYLMKILNYSSPAFIIGFILGYMLEKNLYLSIKLHEYTFFLQPIELGLLLLILAVLAYNIWDVARSRNGEGTRNA